LEALEIAMILAINSMLGAKAPSSNRHSPIPNPMQQLKQYKALWKG
jgi:hypothetical protein